MDMSTLMGTMDPASLGMDAAMVGAVNEMMNYVKERLEEWTWDDKFARFYPIIPFLCAFILCFLTSGMPFDWKGLGAVAKCTVMYGLWANFVFRAYKVTVKGE